MYHANINQRKTEDDTLIADIGPNSKGNYKIGLYVMIQMSRHNEYVAIQNMCKQTIDLSNEISQN